MCIVRDNGRGKCRLKGPRNASDLYVSSLGELWKLHLQAWLHSVISLQFPRMPLTQCQRGAQAVQRGSSNDFCELNPLYDIYIGSESRARLARSASG